MSAPITMKPSPLPSLLSISFNQTSDCFSVGTTDEFIIFQTDPFRETIRRNSSNGAGIGIVQLLYHSNIMALVGGGPTPRFNPNKVMIWDDHLRQCIGELSFRTEVKSVRLRRDRIVVVMLHKIYVYNFDDLKLLHQIETEFNPEGLCEISQSGAMILACLGLNKGQVRVENYGLNRNKLIMAHDSSVACVCLIKDGSLMATASRKGTLIRVFNTLDGSLLQELRRGSERAKIYDLCFSSTAQWLAVTSDKGTVHVFRINGLQEAAQPENLAPASISSLLYIKGVLPKYFSSEWSVAQFRVREGLQHKVAFGHQKNTLQIVGIDGRFYRCEFDPLAGGEMTQLECHNLLNPELK